jgi:hypothetical protein
MKIKCGCEKSSALLTCTFIVLATVIHSCSDPDSVSFNDPPPVDHLSHDVASRWADMTLYTIRFSSFNTPTYASRSLGYAGLTMYESVVQGDATNQSLEGQLNGLNLPEIDHNEKYHWALSLNAAARRILKLLYPVPANSHRFVHERIDSLFESITASVAAKGIDPGVIKRSVLFGEAVADAVYDWSRTDAGDEGYKRNFDPAFEFPSGDSYWIPPIRGQTISLHPLHPYWGENRAFVLANNELPVPDIIPFSTNPESEYYKKYKAVYDKDPLLTQEEMEIAAWWSDDPTETFSPPGHSFYLSALAVKKADVNIIHAAETFARVGMAVCDAFIHCWKVKYTYFNERPSSYVTKYIDSEWSQFWPEPPFPAFPSGHSIQSAAAATVLTNLYGDSFSFTDDAHKGHRRYDDLRFLNLKYPARAFESFWDAANECAYSRFLGGIHTQQDNDVGTAEGIRIGNNINALSWRK